MPKQKVSNGTNARPRNESIAQTAGGLPNDTSHQVEVTDEEVERVERKLKGENRPEEKRK